MLFRFTLVQQKVNPFACDLGLEVVIDCFVVGAQAFRVMVRVAPWKAPWPAPVSIVPFERLGARLESFLQPRQTPGAAPTLVSVAGQPMKPWPGLPKRLARVEVFAP